MKIFIVNLIKNDTLKIFCQGAVLKKLLLMFHQTTWYTLFELASLIKFLGVLNNETKIRKMGKQIH